MFFASQISMEPPCTSGTQRYELPEFERDWQNSINGSRGRRVGPSVKPSQRGHWPSTAEAFDPNVSLYARGGGNSVLQCAASILLCPSNNVYASRGLVRRVRNPTIAYLSHGGTGLGSCPRGSTTESESAQRNACSRRRRYGWMELRASINLMWRSSATVSSWWYSSNKSLSAWRRPLSVVLYASEHSAWARAALATTVRLRAGDHVLWFG